MVVSQRQDAARQLTPGSKLGKYNLIRPIAIGGMAELYLARTVGIEGFEKLVVVKRILSQHAEDAAFIQMFLDEARLAATLHHANIAQVYDIGIERGSYFFSMEYVHGEDLRRIIATSTDQGVPVSLDAALTLIVGVTGGLHYAHQKAAPDGAPLGIVHRDVSPSNVLVSYEGGVKVVDFGIARATGRQANTLSGGLKGKISYMSPEQCRGGAPVDRRSDIFSIGTMLYELSTGSLPFEAETEFQVMTKIVNEDVEPPTRRVPAYPKPLEAIVMRAMARDPAARYGTALELQRDLEDFAHENRLRISPLTLAGVMERMFPAALAEWEKARAQGAYFVEEHVVKTLVGKTTEYTRPGLEDDLTHRGPPPLADDEKTDIVDALPPPTTTQVSVTATLPMAPVPMLPPNAVPIIPAPSPGTLPGVRSFAPPPGAPPPGHLAAVPTPPPGALGAIQVPFAAPASPPPPELLPPPASPAALAAVAVAPASPAVDMTQKVTLPAFKAPAMRDDTGGTDSIAAGRRGAARPLLTGLALLIAAGAVAAVTVMVQQRDRAPADVVAPVAPEPEPSAVDTTPGPAPAPIGEPLPPPPAVDPVADQANQANVEPAPVKDDVAPVPAAVATDPTPADETGEPERATKRGKHDRKNRRDSRRTRKPEVKKPDKPAEAKKPDPPKEKPWSSDSPFMPVRTDK